MRNLRIGVMGCANIAKRSVIPAILNADGLELGLLASRTKEKGKEFSSLFGCPYVLGYEKLLECEDIDAIYMPLPTGLHEEWVFKTLEAGKHILVEKSLAMSFESAKKMVDLAKQRNLLIMENFMFLYHHQHSYVMDIIDSGLIGDIRSFRSSFGFPPLDASNFRYNKKLGGGALLDAAAYTVRVSTLFLGNELKVEAASLNTSNSEVDIYGGAFLRNSEGQFSEVAFGFDNFYQCNYEIWGSKGKLIAHRSFTPGPDFKPVISVYNQDGQKDVEVDSDNHFENILKEFRSCILKGQYSDKYREILVQSKLLQELKEIHESRIS